MLSGACKRRRLKFSATHDYDDGDDNDEVDVKTLRKTDDYDSANQMMFSHCEPLDLSIRSGMWLAWWFNSKVLDLGSRGCGFDSQWLLSSVYFLDG